VRTVALVAAVALVALGVSGCEKRAGLLAAQSSAAAAASRTAPSTRKPPPPTWQPAEAADTKASSVLWDVTAVDATHAWAVGHDTYDPDKTDTTGVPMIQQWDGREWSRTELPVTWKGSLQLVAAGSATDVWAVGADLVPVTHDSVFHVLRYDGTAWREVPFPLGTKPALMQITGLAVVGGHAWLIGGKGSEVIIQEWDGSSWHKRTPPAECTQGGTSFGGMPTFCNFTGITAFAPDDVWVAGNGAWPGFKGPLLFHWDGTAWSPVKVGITNAATAFSSVAGTPGDLWAVGDATGYAGPVAVHGDGRTWQVVEGLPVARYTDLAVDKAGRPWVLENFPDPAATLATYRGGRWADTKAPLPPDMVGISLHAITAVPGAANMFAVGDVDLPGQPRLLQPVLLEYRS
jgi:hypothetical protein